MIKFQVICPECGATVVTTRLEALFLERCPECGLHTWDKYDALMADIIPDHAHGLRVRHDQISS